MWPAHAEGVARRAPAPQERERRGYARERLRKDAAAVLIAVLAWCCALAAPSLGYLLLLTAVTANLWYLGRLRALPITIGTLLLAGAIAPHHDADALWRVARDLPHAVLFVAITGFMGAATEASRRSRRSADQSVDDLLGLNKGLEDQMEEVQCLSEEVRETNDALAAALAASERTAARARVLQNVTAGLSLARSVAEVGEVVMSCGFGAIEATSGCLLLFDEGQPMRVVASKGIPFAIGPEEWSAGPSFRRLELTRGDVVIGELRHNGARQPTCGATDALFTALLLQATADALVRARSYDDERAARQVAELMSQAREEVLGVVAHDLRNPLNLVSTSAQLLMEPGLSTEKRAAVLAISTRAVHRMNRLVGDLLDVVRLETGRLSLELRSCPLGSIVRHAVEALEPRAKESRIALEAECSPDVALMCDEERILQLIDNLVGNALKFTPAGGRVVLGAVLEPGRVRFGVRDNGPGIPEEHCARLFERFWQARSTDRRGIGLGLAIARGIAEAHGGKLWVESTVGQGSHFMFTVPLAS